MAVSSIDLLNTMRANASAEYQERIPVATQDNLATIGSLLTSVGFESTYNEWVGLLGKVALTIFTSRSYQNPLRKLKKGRLPLGETIEEIFIQMAKASTFDPEGTDTLARVLPDGVSLYHQNSFFHTYTASISRPQVINAFTSSGTLDRFFVEVVNALYSGYEQDEYLMAKELILQEAKNGYVIACPTPKDTASSKEFVRVLRQKVMDLGFVSSDYNPLGVLTHTPKDAQVLLIDTATYARVGVDVLASAFNIDQVDWDVRIIPIDNFDGADLTGGYKVFAMLVDAESIQIRDKQIFLDRQHNAKGAFDTLYLHVNEFMGWSHVGNVITFVASDTIDAPAHVGGITATWSDGGKYLLTDENGNKPYFPYHEEDQMQTSLTIHASSVPSSATITCTPSTITAVLSEGKIDMEGTRKEDENVELTITIR